MHISSCVCVFVCVIGTFTFDHKNTSKAKILDSIQVYSSISAGIQFTEFFERIFMAHSKMKNLI